jgi:hypothetical protein
MLTTQYNRSLVHSEKNINCQHCSWNNGENIRGHFYAHICPSSSLHGVIVYRATNRFKYAFNIVLNSHRTDEDYSTLFYSFLILQDHLASKGLQSTRMLLNSHRDKRGKKEHQHMWLVVTGRYMLFDNIFGTVGGWDREAIIKDHIAEHPYEEDKREYFGCLNNLNKIVQKKSGQSYYVFMNFDVYRGEKKMRGTVSY